MIRTRLIFATLALFAASHAGASPLVYINQGQANECVITPQSGTVFTLSTQGDVLIQGSYTSGSCGGSVTPTSPSFSPFTPAPANLTIANNSLASGGGTVTPNFVVYYANACTGKVTPGAGCAAVTGAWGTGGQVCTGQNNATGQLYCSPGSATVSIPANTLQTSCSYTFQAINCTNGTTSINSQTANVTVAAGGSQGVGCVDGSASGDLGTLGYTRQCAGSITSSNVSLHPSWTNTYQDLMSGAWPGGAQFGFGLRIAVNANQFGSFAFNTGSTAAGATIAFNSSYGVKGLLSVSTVPGDVFGGTSVCFGSSLDISSKSNTVAGCKLALNTDYYLNVSNADFFAPHATDCTSSSCTTGWTVYSYGN